MTVAKKRKVHTLKEQHRQNRRTNCRIIYERYLSVNKWQYFDTFGEAWVYLSNCAQKRSIYYIKKGEKNIGSWFRHCTENFPQGFMVAAGVSYKGKLKIRKIEKSAKVNYVYYQTNILTPIFTEDIPSLYGNKVTKVWFHHDKASSHTSLSTVQFWRP